MHQCRLWVKRTRDAQAEIDRLKDLLAKNQSGMEGLFSKLQQYKEKDRVNKMTIAEIKEQYSTKIAALQREIVELKQKNERLREMSAIEEYNLKEQINSLSSDLKKSLRVSYTAGNQQRDFLQRFKILFNFLTEVFCLKRKILLYVVLSLVLSFGVVLATYAAQPTAKDLVLLGIKNFDTGINKAFYEKSQDVTSFIGSHLRG